MLKRKTERKNLLHDKERTLGPGTSTALKTDCTTMLYNPLYLEKRSPFAGARPVEALFSLF